MPPASVKLAVAAVTATSLLAVTGVAAAKTSAQSGAELAACVNKKSGAMRLLNKPSAKCKKSERKVKWALAGPSGPTGAAGAAGASGLMAAFATGNPTVDTSTSDWTTVLTTSFTGASGMLYSVNYDQTNVYGQCTNGDPYGAWARVLINGATEANNVAWQARSGSFTVQLQIRVARHSDNSPCPVSQTHNLGLANLYVQAARLP